MDFPTAMVLPQVFPATANGIIAGVNEAVQRFGKPVILYIKQDRYLPVAAVRRFKEDGTICAVKYAVVRENPADDAYLGELVAAVGADFIVSGIGEVPVIEHFKHFGLSAFTSGSVCIAPNVSMAILAALHAKDFDTAARLRQAFLPLENQRDTINPVRVLHDAVSLCGIAETGPVLPLLDNLSTAEREQVRQPARDLLAFARELAA
jgi:dihydrodipicolinate synthase/N-acetylneuraminate lyase